eukprot:scaffold110193_cov30-Tisochrysis_lutea.AAC.3
MPMRAARRRSASAEGSPWSRAAVRACSNAVVALTTSRASKCGEAVAPHHSAPPSISSNSRLAFKYSSMVEACKQRRRSSKFRAKQRGLHTAFATPVALRASKNGRPRTMPAVNRAARIGASGMSSSAEMRTARSIRASLRGEVGT